MSRLLIHVEGQTEEDFVNHVLRECLVARGYGSVAARIVGNARLRRRRGGIRPWPSVRRDIVNHLRQDPGCIATTMVDYYGLPRAGDDAWPGRQRASGLRIDAAGKAASVEEALEADVIREMGNRGDASRFVPFVVVHEFEGLLFSDCGALSRSIYRPDLEKKFRRIRNGFATPEEINDTPEGAPSKRIEALVPDYEKPLFGSLAAIEIGLESIRAECPHFRDWLGRLESANPLTT